MADQFQQGGTLSDLITTLQGGQRNLNANIALLTAAIKGLFLPRSTGSFTLGASATTAVADTSITATSLIFLMPTNAAAGTLMGSAKSLYVSARTPGTGFTVATASAAAAAGTETFSYVSINN